MFYTLMDPTSCVSLTDIEDGAIRHPRSSKEKQACAATVLTRPKQGVAEIAGRTADRKLPVQPQPVSRLRSGLRGHRHEDWESEARESYSGEEGDDRPDSTLGRPGHEENGESDQKWNWR